MTAQQKSVFLKIRDFLTSYVSFADDRYADICALWAMGTHVYKKFDSFGYLVITARTKQAGKSVLAECLSYVSHDSKIGAGLSASVLRDYVASGKALFVDESEAASSEAASQMRSYLNIGYRQGQMIPVRIGPDEIVEKPAYGPKCFILIGDVNDTLRDRSIIIEMERKNDRDRKIYRPSVAKIEGEAIQGTIDRDNGDSDLTEAIESGWDGHDLFDAYEIPILQGREGEVWTTILSLAQAFCPDRLNAIISCATDLAALKQTTEKRLFTEIRKTSEGAKTDDTYTNYAIRDLMSVFGKKEDRLSSADAIERMKALPTGPWRTYKGTGLDADMLGSLLSVHFAPNAKTGKRIKSIRIGKKIVRGFYKKDVEAAFKKVGE